MNEETKDKALQTALESIKKRFGTGSIMRLGERPQEEISAISTNCLSLDMAIGVGGMPRGRVIEVFGPESCLDEETFIQYSVRKKNGTCQNNKGGTIKRLYDRFHQIPRSGRGNYQRKVSAEAEFFTSCMNDEGRIFTNRIIDVFNTGKKPCFNLLTDQGQSILATADHKFYTGKGFRRLGDLKIGDVVFIHNNTPFTKEHAPSTWRKEVYVKHHPTENTKLVDGKYLYHRMHISRAVVEAHLNGLEYDTYVARLNEGDLEGLIFLGKNDHVHHIDEDHTNDDIMNLEVLSPQEHGRIHALERHNNLRFTAIPDMAVSITPAGIRQTYDIRMESPFNNYIANKFVVHNSGKTTLALQVVAQAQKAKGLVAFIDAEHALDPAYAEKLGVNIDNLLISQPDSGEQALEIAESLVRSSGVDLIVIDSVAALVPQAEIDGEMGDSHMALQARLMSQALRKLTGAISTTNTCFIFINQLRENIGKFGYGPPEVTPGGKALKFYASLRIDIRRIGPIKDGDRVTGNRTKVKIVKNKVAPPFRECEFDIMYGEGISREGDLIDLAVDKGVIEKSGAWFSFDGDRLGQGREKVKVFLKENADICDRIENQVKEELAR